MDATGTDGDCGPWIYSYLGLGNTGYTPSSCSIGSSSSAGTIVSTAYTSSGSGSGLSFVPSPMEAAMPFTCGNYAKLTKIQKKQHVKSLVQEFFGAPSSANCSIIKGGGDMSVLERWLSDMGVGWVLQLGDDGVAASAVTHDYACYARSWVSGLFEITATIHLMAPTFYEIYYGSGLVSILDEFQFAQFALKAMLKMLPFVDVTVSVTNMGCNHCTISSVP